MGHAYSILLVRLKSIGDILFTLPAVDRVRTCFPQARITYLISKEHAPLLKGFRDVDATLELDRALFRRLKFNQILRQGLDLLRKLRQGKFSLAIDFQGYGETAMLTWWTGAPARWGIVNGAARRCAYTQPVHRDFTVHPAEFNLALLRKGGIEPGPIRNQFKIPETASEEGRKFCLERGLRSDRPMLFLQPFTSSEEKNWPLDHYLAIASEWQQGGLQVLFGGGPADRLALEPVRQAGFQVSAGVPLLTSAALAHLSTLVVGGDTGLLHLAVAMNKRVIMVMNSNGPGSTHPFQHPDWKVAPAEGKPLSSISVERVSAACSQALADIGFTPAVPAR
jgi:ADP-heptose:LPS heptosyltransferase